MLGSALYDVHHNRAIPSEFWLEELPLRAQAGGGKTITSYGLF